jgi:spore photoproduct lyase
MIAENRTRPFTTFVMDLFESQDRHRVLFVTKSPEIGNLLEYGNPKKAIVSFSLNAEPVARRWEVAPSVKVRIEAAGLLSDAGFQVRLRIDPMVPIRGWQKAYDDLLEAVFSRLTPERITVGSLRGLQSTINNARDRSWVVYLEERSNWGKKVAGVTRKNMYSHLFSVLKDNYRFNHFALCKETVGMWKELGRDYRRIRCNCVP